MRVLRSIRTSPLDLVTHLAATSNEDGSGYRHQSTHAPLLATRILDNLVQESGSCDESGHVPLVDDSPSHLHLT